MATLEQKLNLSSRRKELVAVGASVGAGCQPCVSHHLNAGAKAGLDDSRLLAAVASAERVTAEAAVLMDEHVRGMLAAEVAPALLSRLEETLASLGAALGANDKTNIERQLKAAAALGVSRDQLREAIETARVVQEHAARIHAREAERLLDALPTPVDGPEKETDSGDGCGCGANEESKAEATDAQAASPVGEKRRVPGPTRDHATNRTKGPRAGCAEMARLFATADSGEMGGIAAAMATYRRMFESVCRPAASAETNQPPAGPETTDPCTKEASQ